MAKGNANQYCLNGMYKSVGVYKIRSGEMTKILDHGSVDICFVQEIYMRKLCYND